MGSQGTPSTRHGRATVPRRCNGPGQDALLHREGDPGAGVAGGAGRGFRVRGVALGASCRAEPCGSKEGVVSWGPPSPRHPNSGASKSGSSNLPPASSGMRFGVPCLTSTLQRRRQVLSWRHRTPKCPPTPRTGVGCEVQVTGCGCGTEVKGRKMRDGHGTQVLTRLRTCRSRWRRRCPGARRHSAAPR